MSSLGRSLDESTKIVRPYESVELIVDRLIENHI